MKALLNGNPLQYCCWKIPRTEDPGGLQSMGSQRVRQDWATSLSLSPLQLFNTVYLMLVVLSFLNVLLPIMLPTNAGFQWLLEIVFVSVLFWRSPEIWVLPHLHKKIKAIIYAWWCLIYHPELCILNTKQTHFPTISSFELFRPVFLERPLFTVA